MQAARKPVARFLDDNPMRIWDAHSLSVTTKDSEGDELTSELQRYWAGSFVGYDMILGMQWLKATDPMIQWSSGRFIWGKIDTNRIQVCSLQELQDTLEPGEEIYQLHPREFLYRPSGEDNDELTAQGLQGGTNQTASKAPVSYLYIATLRDSLRKACELHAELHWLPDHYFEATIAAIPPENDIPEVYKDELEVFSEALSQTLPSSNEWDHAIELEDGKTPPHILIYNLSQRELVILREYLDSSLEKGWIRNSKLPAGALILFVPKSDGSLRLCVDYRGLNKITVKNRYPLPLISELLDHFSHARIYTKLDLHDAYHRL
jgi:hypothetical protein